MKADRILFWFAITTLLLCSISLGGLDPSRNSSAKNLTISEFSAMIPVNNLESAFIDTGAPLATSEDAGTEIAAYTEQAPPIMDLKKLMPSAVLKNPPRYMYYNGDYLAWNDFTTTFPRNNPSLWIERAISWALYATLPLGGWARELIYVPQASTITMYEVYPSGFVLVYNLGFVQPGYYYIWHYADVPGRHSSLFATSSSYSNAIIIDVYPTGNYIKPNPPTPKPSPKAECEKNPVCHWIDGQCLCTGVIDPEKEKCEANPLCDWVNGQCYCRGLDPGPMPGPVPNPNPEPEPGPFNPAPNPVAQCQSNPGCQWDNGRCNCMELGSVIDYSNNGVEEGDLAAAA